MTLPNAPTPARLGFAVKVLGRDGLKSNDARRWQSGPHLSVSLQYLRDIFAYLDAADVRMYRMSSDLAPYSTHPDLPEFHRQVAECAGELEALGDLAASLRLRLSMHPSQFIVLNSPDPSLVAKSVLDLTAAAEILDAMRLGPEAVLVVHAGGAYGDRDSGRARWTDTYRILPEPVRRRLVLENDDIRYSAADVLKIHEATGVPLVFDHQHYWCFNPEGYPLTSTVARFLGTWPEGVRPKIHFSTPATASREVRRKKRGGGGTETVVLPPVWTGHADYVDPFAFAAFFRTLAADAPPFDVMLEAKNKDLALLRLRRDIPRYAPEIAPRFGLPADAARTPDPDAEAEDADAIA
ncbi:MAG TPA: UV DNA damage repair endonuclease UvsE [Armatimonadaceae bacterium]|nr:UV DNA damage repair endonuclease UvsE [Armatimonadaceae bacterium]